MGNGLADAGILLDEADRQIEECRVMYEASLRRQNLDPRLQPRVKNVLENQRSVLEYLAHEVVERHGTPKPIIYYPIADDDESFQKQHRSKLPGVHEKRPDVIALIRSQQPYNGAPWMGHLVQYTNLMKHHGLVPQVRTETTRHTSHGRGGSVSWDPSSVRFGNGVSINGVPVNPTSQMPIGGHVTTTVLVGWAFEGGSSDVLSMLIKIQAGLRSYVPQLAKII